MFLTTVLFALAAQGGPACPIMGSPANAKLGVTDYAGVRYAYCCGGCQGAFEKDPAASIKKSGDKKVIGISLFDPIARQAVDPAKSKGGYSDYQTVRYYFASAENKAAFDKDPKANAATPKKEALYCPVQKVKLEAYGKAQAYADHDGVRYYFCCAGCQGTFAANPGNFVQNAKDVVSAPRVANMPKKDGTR